MLRPRRRGRRARTTTRRLRLPLQGSSRLGRLDRAGTDAAKRRAEEREPERARRKEGEEARGKGSEERDSEDAPDCQHIVGVDKAALQRFTRRARRVVDHGLHRRHAREARRRVDPAKVDFVERVADERRVVVPCDRDAVAEVARRARREPVVAPLAAADPALGARAGVPRRRARRDADLDEAAARRDRVAADDGALEAALPGVVVGAASGRGRGASGSARRAGRGSSEGVRGKWTHAAMAPSIERWSEMIVLPVMREPGAPKRAMPASVASMILRASGPGLVSRCVSTNRRRGGEGREEGRTCCP